MGPPRLLGRKGRGGGDGSGWWDGEPSSVDPAEAHGGVVEPSGACLLLRDGPIATVVCLGAGVASMTPLAVRLSTTTGGGLC
jgi:hypothetical protein